MTTKDIGKKWHEDVSWVSARCNEDMVFGAEKKPNGRWDIPYDAEKPPCNFNQMCVYLHLILDVSQGKSVKMFPGGNPAKSKKIYKFLSDYGYISALPPIIDAKALKSACLLSRGVLALEKYDAAHGSPTEIEKKMQIGKGNTGYSSTKRSKE